MLTASALRVHELANTGRCHEALAAAVEYEAAARGDLLNAMRTRSRLLWQQRL